MTENKKQQRQWHTPPAADLSAEDQTEARAQICTYLHSLGHLSSPSDGNDAPALSQALSSLQASAGLPQTGKYDSATSTLVATPRCGYTDPPSSGKDFAYLGNKWDHTDLAYRFDSWCNDLNQAQVRSAISRALSKWSNVSPLVFREVPQGTGADIRIRFAVGDHGDGSPFDNGGTAGRNVLAHAFAPGNGDTNIAGDCHFDDFEVWNENFLHGVALHEFGHSIGLGHSADATSVMYAWFNGVVDLQKDDIAGVQSRYGPRTKGWFNFSLEPQPTVGLGAGITAVSRRDRSMEVWWIRGDGAVVDGYWNNEPQGWAKFVLAGPGSAAPGGGIAAVSRASDYMEIFWVGPRGSIEGAWWSQGAAWGRQRLSPEGSAALNTRVTAVSRIKDAMEVWYVAPNGSVQGLWWTKTSNWNRYELAPAGSAAPGSGIKAVSRYGTTMEVWWVTPSGAIADAYWYEGAGWKRFELAPAGSAAIGSGIGAISRIKSSMEVFWIAPNRSVQDAYFYDGPGWRRFELAPAGSAAVGGISAVARIGESMEVWWVGPNGSLQDAYWYPANNGWRRFELGIPGTARVGADIAVVSRIDNSMELWFPSPSGSVTDYYWYG